MQVNVCFAINLLFPVDKVPSSPPDNVQCFAVSSRGLYITWTPPRQEDRNGVLVEYGVFYRPLILWQGKTAAAAVQYCSAYLRIEKVHS